MLSQKKINCPICREKNTWHAENALRPFCSERCKLIDLGEWAKETRKIPCDPLDPDSFNDDSNFEA